MTEQPSASPEPNPFDILGEATVALVAKRFYDHMEASEPALTAMHRLGDDGRLHPEVRERFALFLAGWLGGPQEYMARHGHPRLRMRHAKVQVDTAARDAWLRCMYAALDDAKVEGPLRAFLDMRFADVANFLRNAEG
jgi:hemoglobin